MFKEICAKTSNSTEILTSQATNTNKKELKENSESLSLTDDETSENDTKTKKRKLIAINSSTSINKTYRISQEKHEEKVNDLNQNEEPYELDTAEISLRVRQYTRLCNIDRAEFAENTLEVTKSYLLELISICPRPWHELSDSCKKIYHKMHSWLENKRNDTSVQSLISIKNQSLDIQSVATILREVLKVSSIPHDLFASKILDQPLSALTALLSLPHGDWNELNEQEQIYYQLILVWSLSLAKVNALKEMVATKEENADFEVEINTLELTEKVKNSLDSLNIPHWICASYVLNVDRKFFQRMIAKPKSWSILNEHEKKIYKHLNNWLASQDKVSSLKRLNESIENIRKNLP